MKIDKAMLEGLVEKQEGKCAICGRPWEVVDHDHATGIVRGLLCQRCNKGIGALGDTSERLSAALDYLVTTEKE